MSELTSLTIAELREGFVGGEFTAREIAEAYNGAVEAAKLLNAYTVTTPQDALGAEFVAAMDDGDALGDVREVESLLDGGVATADHRHVLVTVEEAVAGGAGRDAKTLVDALAGDA